MQAAFDRWQAKKSGRGKNIARIASKVGRSAARLVLRWGLLGFRRFTPPGSPPEKPAALNLACGQVVEPDC